MVTAERYQEQRRRFLAAKLHTEALLAVSLALVDESRASRRTRPFGAPRRHVHPEPSSSLLEFRLEGWLGDRPVNASFEDGKLSLDDRLATQAMLLVDLGETFVTADGDQPIGATLDGPPQAVFLTLIRACERVTGASFLVPRERTA
jgi:hypothetical protein